MKQITRPDGGSTSYSYNTGSTLPWTTTTTVAVSATQSFTSTTTLDGLGRSVSSQTTDPNASGGYRYGKTVFNSLGQVVNVYNPYFTTSDPTYGKFSYSYDALGRITNRNDPAGFNTNTSYSGRARQVQYYPSYFDQQTIYQSDGLGRTVSVCEVTTATQMGSPSSPSSCNLNISGTGFLTTYAYDASGNLTQVTHPNGAVRTYQYDGLSRLTSASDPEVGTPSGYYAYTYNYDTQSAGDLYQRTGPTPNQTGACPPNCITTTYIHDAMHRLTNIEYSQSGFPWKSFSYDDTSDWGSALHNTKGRLTNSAVTPTSALQSGEIFSYDAMGRVHWTQQCTPSTCGTSNVYTLAYTYDYLGDVLTATDGTGITYTNQFNQIGQLNQIATNWLSPTQSGNIVSGIQYNALGKPTSDLLNNGIQESWTYGLDGSQATYNAGSAYNFSISSIIGGTFVYSANDSVNGNWSYNYDNFGRITSSSCSGSCPFGQSATAYTYAYDAEGNRWQQNLTQGTGNNSLHTFGAWNHINDGSVIYDSAGEITNDSFHSYTYDPEGNLLKVDNGNTATYIYDAFGRRVSQQNSSGTFEFLFDLQNHPITKVLPNGGGRVSGEVWFGRHWASNPGTELNFMHPDWLGAGRVWTDLNGNATLYCKSLPFGDGLYCPGSGNNFDDVYAGLKYNFDDSLYDSQTRQYNQSQGRWSIPDPARMAAVDPTDPQTWNRYAYVMNNPVSMTDPSGLCVASGICSTNNFSQTGFSDGSGPNPPFIVTNDTGMGMTMLNNIGLSQLDMELTSIMGGSVQGEAAYASWVNAIWQAGGSTFTPPGGVPVSLNWTISGGVYGTNQANGEMIDAAGLAELIGASPSGELFAQVFAANNGTPTTPVVQKDNGKSIPNVPPEWGFCNKYRDGSGAGSVLYNLCMTFPNGPVSNCMRGKLLNQYTPNPNPAQLVWYLFPDHFYDAATCAAGIP